jgi:hypothetical protein
VCSGIACRSRKSLPINAAIITLSLTHCVNAAVVPNTTFINPANGHTYFVLEGTTWEAAQAEAATLGGNLVTINDSAENQWLVDTFAGLPGFPFTVFGPNDSINSVVYWTGLNDIAVEGVFEWVSGEPVTYLNWAQGEPNNLVEGNEDWGHLYIVDGSQDGTGWIAGEWNDGISIGINQRHPKPAIVELTIPEPSSLVMLGAALTALTSFRRQS